MSIFDRKKPPPAPPETKPVALATAVAAIKEAVQLLEHAEIDAVLLRAQLADHCRDADTAPLDHAAFAAVAAELDGEAWRRLAALATLWDHPELGALVGAGVRRRGAGPSFGVMLAVVRGKRLLTMELLRMSALRVEELTRAGLAAFGIAIAGETPAQSAIALARLDYERLLAEAEKARKAAEGRIAQLEKAQDEEDKARAPRRGKW
jgi:hypothetical protein